MKYLAKPQLIAGALVLGLLIAACGGADPTATPISPTATRPPAATATVAPAATATTAATRPAATAAPAATATARPAATNTPPPAATNTAVPQSSGQIRVAMGRLQWVFVPDLIGQRIWQDPVFDHVVGTTLSGTLSRETGFATSWESPDFKTWTVKLRPTLVFHSGEKATSKDVKYGIEFPAREGSTSTAAAFIKNSIGSIDTPDDTTLIINLKNPDYSFLLSTLSPLSINSIHYVIPANYMRTAGPEGFNKAPIGTGPFKVRELNVGNNMVMEATGPHWFYGTPRFKTLEWLQVPEETARLALRSTGRAEVTEVSRAKTAEAKRAGSNIFAKDGSGLGLIFMHGQHSKFSSPNPLADVRVREALNIAVDRKTIVETFMGGQANASSQYPLLSYDPAWKQYPVVAQNQARARQMIKDSGFEGTTISLNIYAVNTLPEGVEVMEQVAVWWEQVGIKVQRVPVDFNGFITTWYSQKIDKPTISGLTFLANRARTVVLSTLCVDPNNRLSARIFEDDVLEKLGCEWTKATTDDQYRARAYAYQEEAFKQWRYFPLFEAGENYAVDPKLGNTWVLGKVAYSLNINEMATGKQYPR